VRDPCRKEGPQALISELWSAWQVLHAKLVKSVCLMPSAVGDSARSKWRSWLLSLHLFIDYFAGHAVGTLAIVCLGVVIQGVLEGLLWSDVDIGVEELRSRSRADDGS